jgi:hypothetical protein
MAVRAGKSWRPIFTFYQLSDIKLPAQKLVAVNLLSWLCGFDSRHPLHDKPWSDHLLARAFSRLSAALVRHSGAIGASGERYQRVAGTPKGYSCDDLEHVS